MKESFSYSFARDSCLVNINFTSVLNSRNNAGKIAMNLVNTQT
jgi:hypothetical protein